jgi:cytochrome c oxidase accessory protein FixG
MALIVESKSRGPGDPPTSNDNNDKNPSKVTSILEAQEAAVREAKRLRAAKGGASPAPAEPAARKIQRIIPLAEADATGEALYARRQKVYPREVHGLFARWRVIMVLATLGLYYVLPWINWGAGRQAFLVDLPHRKFNLFFWTFWPQDLFYLTAILIISALSLFLFTAIAGRLWCGYTCPQTVWTEVFLWIERLIEGDRMKQMKLAAGRWTGEKIVKRSSKHFVWIVFSLWTGFTFVGYFTPIRELVQSVITLALGPWEIFWIFFYGFATYGNAGFLREQVCIYMCPYARFQSAMFDKDTLVISYDPARGEPRGSRKKNADYKAQGLGDCIDCTMCVQVCPTGIDIRNGLQYQCISCGACIDACDSVMDKMGYPRGLIRYTTQNELAEGKPRHILRPRVVLYSAILGGLTIALVVAVLLRTPLELDVIRDRNTLFRETPDGRIENVYTLKIMNMDGRPHTYRLSVAGIEDLRLRADRTDIPVGSGQVVEQAVTLSVDPSWLRARSTPINFLLEATDVPRQRAEAEARFVGPAR